MDPCSNDAMQTILPDDCLFIIFQKLEDTTDRNAFGLTCRRWLQIQNLSRRSLVFQFSYNPSVYHSYARYLPRLLTRFPQLNMISLAGFSELSDSALNHLRNSGESLRSLSLYCCFGITDNGLALVSSLCLNLVSLTLYRCNITDIGLEFLSRSCQALENVNLSYCKLISDWGMNALSSGCLKLRALMISCCRGVTGIGLKGCPSSLTYLEAESCLFTPEGLLNAVSGGGLEYLNLTNLRSSDGLDGIGAGYATRLRFLNLRMCRFVGDDSVSAIAKGCPMLEEWSLALCHEVRAPGWESVGLNCKHLKVLHVNRSRNLCDRGLQALRDGSSRLKVLYMHNCRRVSSLAMEMFKLHRHDVEIRTEDCLSVGPCIEDLFA